MQFIQTSLNTVHSLQRTQIEKCMLTFSCILNPEISQKKKDKT